MGHVDSTNGGWAEQEDRDSRAADRNNGNDGSYNRTWNDRLANDRFGYGGLYNERTADTFGRYSSSSSARNSISGAVNNVRSSVASAKHNTLTNNALASPSVKVEDSYHRNVLKDTPYEDAFGKFLNNMRNSAPPANPSPSAAIGINGRNLAQRDFLGLTERKEGLNTFGTVTSAMLGAAVPAKNAVQAVGKMVAGKALNNAGNIVNNVDDLRSKTLNSLSSIEDKMAYNYEMNKLEDELADRLNSPRNKLGRGLATAGSLVASFSLPGVGSIFGAGLNSGVKSYQTMSSIRDMAKEKNREALQQSLAERDARIEQAQRERELNRSMKNGGKSMGGILDTMSARVNQNELDLEPINAIPTLTNFWKNVYIK